MTYKQSRQLSHLISKISTATEVEESVIVHFLLLDLNRIYENRISIHIAQLKNLEYEFSDLSQKEEHLLQSIERRNKNIIESQTVINKLNLEIERANLKHSEIQDAIKNLRNKSDSINKDLSTLEREKKQLEYNVMMKSHSIKKKTDDSFKKIDLILTGFTILGIIIAIILILKR